MDRVRKIETVIDTNGIHSTLKDFHCFYKKIEGLKKAMASHFEKLI